MFSITVDRGTTVFLWALYCYLQTSESEILWCCSIKMPALQDLAHSLCILQLSVAPGSFGLAPSAITMVSLSATVKAHNFLWFLNAVLST